MKRREFNMLIAGAVCAWSTMARAERAPVPVIGLLNSTSATAGKLLPFLEGLKIEGFVRNQNFAIEQHSAAGDYSRLPRLAADLAGREVALIAVVHIQAAFAAKAATTTIPIVFAISTNPVTAGLVSDLNHSGSNLTGAANMLTDQEQKRVELLHGLLPAAKRFGLLINPNNPNADGQAKNALNATERLGFELEIVHVITKNDYGQAFTTLAKTQISALLISDDDLFSDGSTQLAALASSQSLPTISPSRSFVAAGGLMSYGRDLTETYHQAGVYAGLILRGGKPAELPIYQSQRDRFSINLKSAKSLGLTFPPALMNRADEVIE